MHFWPRITPENLQAIQSILTPFYKPIINQIYFNLVFQITMQKIKYNAVEKIKIKNAMQKIKISQQSL